MEPDKLFQDAEDLDLSERDELNALASGAKAMSHFGFRGEDVREPCDEYVEIVKFAIDHGLLVVLHPEVFLREDDLRIEHVKVFVVQRTHLDRVGSYLALDHAKRSYPREYVGSAMSSHLLGYDQDTIDRWIANEHSMSIGHGMTTVYLVLDQRQRALLQPLGFRCFHPDVLGNGTTLYFDSDRQRRIRQDPELPPDARVARFGMEHNAMFELFRGKGSVISGIVTCSATADDVTVLNNSILTKIQIMEDGRWQ
jgi:hypothetical protein